MIRSRGKDGLKPTLWALEGKPLGALFRAGGTPPAEAGCAGGRRRRDPVHRVAFLGYDPHMHKRIAKASRSAREHFRGQHRFEHWYVDNQVYFITARCRDRFPVFACDEAKAIFWDRFEYYADQNGFVPWVTSLMDNHYHTLGYLREGMKLQRMMQRLHGSVAKLVNDVLERGVSGAPGTPPGTPPAEAGCAGENAGCAGENARLVPFWRDTKGREYFDGCIRDEKQARLAYRYTLLQSVRHGICGDWRAYPHTRVKVELERAVERAHLVGAFMEGVPYRRYER